MGNMGLRPSVAAVAVLVTLAAAVLVGVVALTFVVIVAASFLLFLWHKSISPIPAISCRTPLARRCRR